MKKTKFLFLIVSLLMITVNLNVADATEKKETKAEQLTEHELQQFIKPPKFLPGEILFYADWYEGYDNNVNLDSTRKGDTYSELALEVGYKQPFKNDFDITLDYYLSALSYHEVTDGSFYDSNLSVELEKEIFDSKADLGLSSNFEYNYYPKDESSVYYAIEPKVFIQHNFNENVYQKVIYSFLFKEYTDRKTQDTAGADKAADRKDLRNTIAHELRAIVFDEYVLKLKNQYFFNNSNDQYLDYYDYYSYRVDATAILPVFPLFFKDLYGLVNLGYQLRDYTARSLIDDTSRSEEDNFYNVISSLIYDLNDKLSLSFNYVYSQNESNEPSEEYSGSTFSLGFHYAF